MSARAAATDAPSRRERVLMLTLLAGIVLIGGWLRCAQLEARGLLLYDEGVHLLVARFLSRWWSHMLHHGWAAGQVFLGHPEQWGGFPSSYCKPGHDLLLAAALLCGGPTPVAALRAVALVGTGSLVAVYWLGRRVFDAWVGVTAAALSAVSVYQLTYARSALAEVDAGLWLMLAVGVLMAGSSTPSVRRLLASGVCGGITFLVSCSLPMILPCLWLIEILRTRAEGERALPVRRLLLLALGVLAPIMLWMGVDWWLLHAVRHPNATYVAQVGTRLLKHSAQPLDLAGWYAYPYMLTVLDGLGVSVLCALGLLLVWWRGGWTGRAVASVSLVVVGCYSVYHTHHARYIAPVLPLLMLAAAWVVVCGVRWAVARMHVSHLQPFVLAGVVLGLMGWRLPSAVDAARPATGYARVLPTLQRLDDGGQRPFITTQHFILRFLAGERSMPPPPTEALLRDWIARYGVRYCVVDYQLDFGGFGSGSQRLAQSLAARLTPVVVIPNPAGASPQVELEHVTDLALTRRRLADADVRARNGAIAVYDLWQLPELHPATPTE